MGAGYVVVYIIHKFHDKITKMSKKKKTLILSYILLAGILFFYVNSVLKRSDLKTYSKKEVKIKKTYPVTGILSVQDGVRVTEFTKELKNTDSIEELLRESRKDKEFTYEIIKYTYGAEISSVNGIEPKEGFKWAIIKNGEDITLGIGDAPLENNAVYELRLIKK